MKNIVILLLLFIGAQIFAQKSDTVAVRQLRNGAISCRLFTPERLVFSYVPHDTTGCGYFAAEMSVNTALFCDNRFSLNDRIGTTIWLVQGANLSYPEFLRKYRLENNADAKSLQKYSKKLIGEFYQTFPPDVVAQLIDTKIIIVFNSMD